MPTELRNILNPGVTEEFSNSGSLMIMTSPKKPIDNDILQGVKDLQNYGQKEGGKIPIIEMP